MFRIIFSVLSVGFLFCMMAPARAEDAAPTESTRIELLVTGSADMTKGSSSKEESEALPEKAMRVAIQRSIKAANDLSGDFPKCHFRLVSLTAMTPERPTTAPRGLPPLPALGQPGAPQMPVAVASPSESVTLRVGVVGEQGCLTLAK